MVVDERRIGRNFGKMNGNDKRRRGRREGSIIFMWMDGVKKIHGRVEGQKRVVYCAGVAASTKIDG